MEAFEEATDRDAEFAAAWAGACQARLGLYARGGDTGDFDLAERACTRALTLEPERAEVHIALGALYLGGHRTATVVADEPTEAFMMSSAVLAEIERDAPELAAEFHRFAARLSAERLLGANKAVRALLY